MDLSENWVQQPWCTPSHGNFLRETDENSRGNFMGIPYWSVLNTGLHGEFTNKQGQCLPCSTSSRLEPEFVRIGLFFHNNQLDIMFYYFYHVTSYQFYVFLLLLSLLLLIIIIHQPEIRPILGMFPLRRLPSFWCRAGRLCQQGWGWYILIQIYIVVYIYMYIYSCVCIYIYIYVCVNKYTYYIYVL